MGDFPKLVRPGPYLVDDRQYRLLVESVTDYAIYMLDPEGTVSSWNAGAARFKGYAASEVIGRNFAIFYSLEDQATQEPQKALARSAKEGRFVSEGWRIRKDGTSFWASVVIDPIYEDGQIAGFAKITRDISDRRETEQALIQANAALHQSQKMEAIGQLTGGIAHDFNNLLAAVLGSLELLRKRIPSDAKAVRLLDNAVQGARRGTALTQRMLAFARQQEFTPALIDVPNLVRGMTDLIQTALGPTVSIETRLPLQLNSVRVDANQLEMALLNLAVNARDAMPGGGVIVVEVREESLAPAQIFGLSAGSYVCLSVTDPGMGMDKSTLSRAMEPFYTTKGPGQGTGLGLSMVHGIAIQAGGTFILKSEVGKGTTAEIWLPLTGVQHDTAAVLSNSSRPSRSTAAISVLAVDDDPLVLLNTVMMLEDLGHRVFEAYSGERALELLNLNREIELVVTDIAMPNMSGLQLFHAAQHLYPSIRFLLATGYAEASPEDEPTLTRLAKPFGQDDLAAAIRTTLATDPLAHKVLRFPAAQQLLQ